MSKIFNSKVTILIIALFLVTRLFIWHFKPPLFTEIIYSYMPYAHLWASGVTPYLEQWYEYPPATIPLFYIPHVIDNATYGTSIALNYMQVYRGMLLMVDAGILILIWKVLRKYKASEKTFAVSLVYYSLVTAKAHHFIYDTMDITFAAAMVLAVAAPILFRRQSGTFFNWLGTFLATALKLVNAPLIPIYAVLQRKNWRKSLLLGLLAFLLVWALPLMYFRSSLQVMFVYHQIRGLQIDSAPAVITLAINTFTQSEQVKELYKNYEIVGPVSSTVKEVFDVVFYLAIGTYVIFGLMQAWQAPEKKVHLLRQQLTMGYIFLFMITAKVLSTPFLLWHIPFLAMYPYENIKQQARFLLPSALAIVLSMTLIPNVQLGIINLALLIGFIRTGVFAFLFVMTLKLIRDNKVRT